MKNRATTLWHIIPTLLVVLLVFSGCAALKEAQERRAKRLLEERNSTSLMLKRSDATINIAPNALSGESDHYTLKFAEDLHGLPSFDEIEEREEFIGSALLYMESLYDAMSKLFGFQPKHKIHVTLHDAYRGNRLAAFTTTHYRSGIQNGRYVKFINGIGMDFPMQMYEKTRGTGT